MTEMMKLSEKMKTMREEQRYGVKKGEVGLIALDLDGTTLRKDRSIGERTRRALQTAAEKGVHVVIATGRSLLSLPQEALSIKGIEYAITSNGAKIVRLSDGELLYAV